MGFFDAPLRRLLATWVIAGLGLYVPLLAAPAGAQAPWADSLLGGDAAEDDAQPTVEELRNELSVINSEIEALRAGMRSGSGATAGEVPGEDEPDGVGTGAVGGSDGTNAEQSFDAVGASRLRWLEKTRSLIGQQIDELQRAETLRQTADDLASMSTAGVASLVDHEPPFGFEDLDSVLSRLEASRTREALLEDAVAAGVEALEEAKSRLRSERQSRSRARERLDSVGASQRAEAEANLELQRIATRMAETELAQIRLQLNNDRRELDLADERQELLESGVEWIRTRLRPTPDRLDARVASLQAEQEEARARLTDLRGKIEREEARLLQAQSAGRSDETEASRNALDLLDHRERLLEERIDRRDLLAELWRLRHRLASENPKGAERREILAAVSRDVAELERDRRLLQAKLQDLRASENRVAERLLEGPTQVESDSLRRRASFLDEQSRFFEAQVGDVETALTLARRVASEASSEGLDPGEIAAGAWSRVVSFWRWQITEVDSRSITLGMVILALLLLIAGYLASKRISQSFGRVLQQRFGLSSGAAAALQSIAFYLMVIAFVLWAMQLVSIPLTVFTLLGGVLAIGIGFGSQNVVNNFISGLILLVERPVKVGDLIEVDGTVGSVERIGLRSARVRSGDNTHIVVPNSTFLEQKVLNWTVTDDLVRTQVDVGIAYGSKTREAERLMLQALEGEPRVVQNMPKEVHFLEFGDNALLFRAYFWIRVKVPLDTQRVGSALRFRIDELFADAGIVIAFPQRDVHLDTLSPLQIRLLDRPAESEKKDSSEAT